MSLPRMTVSQRERLQGLLRKAGCYDLRTVTLMHRRLGVPERWIGLPADSWLDSLSVADAAAIIDELVRETA
jgi:hypothetical protein